MTTVSEALTQVPVTRLVHFTPVVNLPGILTDGQIRATTDLAGDAQPHHSVTDAVRIDGQPELVCCSFEYPNPYYEAVARNKVEFRNYPMWVCLILNRDLVTTPGTRFYPCNAAKHGGAHGETGGDAMLAMWDSPSQVGGYNRGASHNPAVPTDLQAEVQVPGPISLSAVEAIVVESEAQAEDLFAWLQLMDARPERLQWKVAPTLFNKYGLVAALHHGQPVVETVITSKGVTP